MRHAFVKKPDGVRLRKLALTLAVFTTLAGCGGDEPKATSADGGGASVTPAQQAGVSEPEQVTTLEATDASWAPEALENILAPVALYPDIVLSQVLIASTNPQEVLDAGNWLLENPSLKNEALDESAQQAGFTPPIRALIQLPQVVDMMCQDLDWTAELGQAYVNDQAGVLDAVQRLRVQAEDVGNLHSSDEMKVETVTQDNQQVVTISPPGTQIVYVPQYDPVAVYAPPPTTTTTTVVQNEGYSTGALVTTGLLAFGAGMLINELFDDDDDDYYYGGGYWGRPAPYYPPYAYRPRYGDGFYPSHGYNRGNGNFNNNTVIVNQNNNYWKNRSKGDDRSPISEARKNRPELNTLNAQAAKGPRRAAPVKVEGDAGVRAGIARGEHAGLQDKVGSTQRVLPKIQGSYAGAKPGAQDAKGKIAAIKPDGVDRPREMPKLQGAYAGAKPAAQQRPASGLTDRGRALSTVNSSGKPAPALQKPFANRSGGAARSSALSGSNRGTQERAASLRGRQSMQHRAAPKSRAKPQRKLRQ